MRKEFYRPGMRVLARKALSGREKSTGKDATAPEGARGEVLAVHSEGLLECEFTWQEKSILVLADAADVAPQGPLANRP